MNHETVEALKTSGAWPHPVAGLELIETHCSWVFLTGEFAYKIKKPVNFGFLDFSTLDKRLHCCREELRLNRRLASTLYLDVVPIAGSPPRVGGSGKPFEYAVKMRQFDMDCGFDRLAQRGALSPRHMDETASVLAAFHATAERADEESGFGSPAEIVAQVLENFDQVESRIGEQAPGSLGGFERAAAWSRSVCETHVGVFANRLAEGFVRECHGDLHLRNIVWWQEKVIPFDCIEFNPSLRWIDVMSELAFLLMDLDDHGLPGLSQRLLNAYLELTGDFGGLEVLRIYQAYRAMVRAKVASLRLVQRDTLDEGGVAELESYLRLAASYTRSPAPRLVIAHGLSGSGKTYVSQKLLEAAPLVRLRSDVERKRLFGLSPTETSGSGQDAGIYTQSASERTYERLAQLSQEVLESGWSVLVDATFLRRRERDRFRALAQACGCPFAIMHCEADMAVQRARVLEREGDASEANLEVLERQQQSEEPLADAERDVIINVDTTGAPRLDELVAFLGA
ncbi:MAG: AAA family ATPase [Xanthomonadales bacterium]|jgi:aminoglycoside phosphotransferase family enzyme/gluconate kinase|nr:AAA family ATPase [Xanthomonadales bacterium]